MSAASQNRLVVALDYGTTYTGVAYAWTTESQPHFDRENINVLTNWPKTNARKVPSLISTSPSTKKGCRQWGFDIDDSSVVIKAVKLELDRKGRLEELKLLVRTLKGLAALDYNDNHAVRNDIPTYLVKDDVEIVKSYLAKVADTLLVEIASVHGSRVAETVYIDLIVTHPAKWSAAAKNKTYRTVFESFSPRFPHLRHIHMITEPEACALFTLKSAQRDGTNTLKVGDAFVVCDVGGGTIDLVSYRVQQLKPELKIEKIGLVSGAKVGAANIDEYFLHTFLPERLGKADYERMMAGERPTNGDGGHWLVTESETRLLERFEGYKHSFDGSDNDGIPREIILPRLGNLDDNSRGIRKGRLIITTDDMIKMFDSTVRAALTLISEQVTQVTVNHRLPAVNCIFLSGGFTENPYFLEQVRNWATATNIRVERGDECWTAVVKGAVLAGLSVGMSCPPPVKGCLYNFGLVITERFVSYKHKKEDYFHDGLDGIPKAKNQIHWLISKGDLIRPERATKATYNFARHFQKKDIKAFSLVFVVNSEDRAPTRKGDAAADQTLFFNIDYDLENIPQADLKSTDGRVFTAILTLTVEVLDEVKLYLKCNKTSFARQQFLRTEL